jgi:integrase
VEIMPELTDHLERFADPKQGGLVFIAPKGRRLRRSNFRKFWERAKEAISMPELHFHDLRQPATRWPWRKGPASRNGWSGWATQSHGPH